MNNEVWEIVGSGKPTGRVLKETIGVSGTISISVQVQYSRILLRDLFCGSMRKMHREPGVREAEAQVGKWLDCRARITSKERAPLHSMKNGILQNACSTSPTRDADLGEKSSYAHRQVDEQPSKRSQKNGDKSAVAMLKITRQLGCVFQDMEPPKSSSILRKSSNIRKPIQLVNSQKPSYVMLTFEARIHRLE